MENYLSQLKEQLEEHLERVQVFEYLSSHTDVIPEIAMSEREDRQNALSDYVHARLSNPEDTSFGDTTPFTIQEIEEE
ncbi:MAG: hypothetical protein Q9187_008735 [Circinaria calcarea]